MWSNFEALTGVCLPWPPNPAVPPPLCQVALASSRAVDTPATDTPSRETLVPGRRSPCRTPSGSSLFSRRFSSTPGQIGSDSSWCILFSMKALDWTCLCKLGGLFRLTADVQSLSSSGKISSDSWNSCSLMNIFSYFWKLTLVLGLMQHVRAHDTHPHTHIKSCPTSLNVFVVALVQVALRSHQLLYCQMLETSERLWRLCRHKEANDLFYCVGWLFNLGLMMQCMIFIVLFVSVMYWGQWPLKGGRGIMFILSLVPMPALHFFGKTSVDAIDA